MKFNCYSNTYQFNNKRCSILYLLIIFLTAITTTTIAVSTSTCIASCFGIKPQLQLTSHDPTSHDPTTIDINELASAVMKYTTVRQHAVEYARFLQLKYSLSDFDAEIISPSAIVDNIWHRHLLDNKHYLNYCLQYFGRIIFHNPDGAIDRIQQNKRYEKTLMEYKKLYQSDAPASVWPASEPQQQQQQNNNDYNNNNKRKKNQLRLSLKRVYWQPAEQLTINMKGIRTVEQLMAAVEKKTGIRISSQRLSCNLVDMNRDDRIDKNFRNCVIYRRSTIAPGMHC